LQNQVLGRKLTLGVKDDHSSFDLHHLALISVQPKLSYWTSLTLRWAHSRRVLFKKYASRSTQSRL